MAPPSLASWRGPLVYVADVTIPQLSSEDRHHLERVLRLKPGAPLALGDGAGRWRTATFGPLVECTSEVFTERFPAVPLSLTVALPKGDRADWLLQKATELGIDELVVLESEHSVVRWPAPRRERQLERVRRIVRSAAAQSRRAWLPAVGGPVDFGAAAARPGTVLAVPGGGPLAPGWQNVMIGPEGGWSETELGHGLPTVGLGPQVLRVETAALAASTLLVALRSRLVLPPTIDMQSTLGG